MATLQVRLQDLASRVAAECKALRTLTNGNAADLAALTTTAKTNLVAAVNELKHRVDVAINDTTTSFASTWSSQKISDQITAALAAVTNGAPGALDTLKELADAIGDDANFAGTVTTALAARVRVDTDAQGLTTPQKQNARTNIGALSTDEIGNPDTDFTATFEAGLV